MVKEINQVTRVLIDLQSRDHNDLTNRDTAGAHPASAIDGIAVHLNSVSHATITAGGTWQTSPSDFAKMSDGDLNTSTTEAVTIQTALGLSFILIDLGARKFPLDVAWKFGMWTEGIANAIYRVESSYNGITFVFVDTGTTNATTEQEAALIVDDANWFDSGIPKPQNLPRFFRISAFTDNAAVPAHFKVYEFVVQGYP